MRIALLAITLLYAFAADTVTAQVPGDFMLIANAGGGENWDDYSGLRIDAQGNAVFTIYESRYIGSAQISKLNFQLTSEQMNDLWTVLNDNTYFSLNSAYANDSLVGRSFARLAVTANGSTKNVISRNIAVVQFDNIISRINEITPENAKLIYDISDPEVIVPKELCNGEGAIILKSLVKPRKYIPGEIAADKTSSVFPAHPGTTLGCDMSIEEAVNKGIAEIGAKGEYEGDAVSLSIDNSTQQSCDRLTMNLALEFYGEKATDADAIRIQNAIQEGWKGYKTSEGKDLEVLVDIRISPGAKEAPGTPGYHQIELVDDGTRSHLDKVEEVNQGTGSGKWELNTDNEVYAHEAGHLMGLDDEYEDYNKMPDGKWENASTGEVVSAEELAHRVDEQDPTGRTWQEILDKLNDPDFTTGSVPKPGHWDDLMGSTQGKSRATQQDIDDLTADPGVIVRIPAGSTFLNENWLRQNMMSTRNEYMFTANGETRQLNGIYASCIDGLKLAPRSVNHFDLGPHISKWNGIESARVMEKLVNHINKKDLLCEGSISVYAIWRVSDNFYVGDPELDGFFAEAGIEPTLTAYDFPRMKNISFDGKTQNITPPELFISKASADPAFVSAGEKVNLSAVFNYPSIDDQIQTTGEWTLMKPDGSIAAPDDFSNTNSGFTPDVRGIYQAKYEMQVKGPGYEFDAAAKPAVVLAGDEWTESFESGKLEGNTRINWVTYGHAPWRISEFDPHSGKFCAESGIIWDNEYTALRVNVIVPSDDQITFAYKVSSSRDSLLLLIDDVVVKGWANDLEWGLESVPITAGPHFVTWMYKKDSTGYGGLDMAWIDNILFPPNTVLTEVDQENFSVLTFKLEQNYPNPFNPSTEISFSIPEDLHVTLKVYDLLGREAALLVNEDKTAGNHKITFEASGLSSGIYFYRIKAGNYTEVKRMMLLK